MDANRFDAFAREFRGRASRRAVLGLSMVGGLNTISGISDAEAKKKKCKKKCTKKRGKKKTCRRKKPGTPSCGPCRGGECQDGACVCPFSGPCSPGVCCETGQTCLGGACQACPVGVTPCDVTLTCGQSAQGKPCACMTTVAGGTACVGVNEFNPVYCTACDSDAVCENLLGLPGQVVCVGGVGCSVLCDGLETGCAVKGCVDVEFCEETADCSSGECIQHRCQ